MLLGSIDGIKKIDFERLKRSLDACFDEVQWKDNRLTIKSSREHPPVKEIFSKIAASVQPGCFGSLLYVGHGNIACFYFGHKQYVGRRFKEPTPPEWWLPASP